MQTASGCKVRRKESRTLPGKRESVKEFER
jgi:hypothetical protein